MHWYQLAASQGDAEAENNLGWSYREGAGIERDPAKAAVWFRSSAQQGNAYGQLSLGQLYRTGLGVEANPVLAYAWIDLAAKSGDPDAIKERDSLGKSMKPAELTQARRLSAAWKVGAAMEIAGAAKK